MVISLKPSLEIVPRIKFLIKTEGENQFQSSVAGDGDSNSYASFRLRIFSLDGFPDNISQVTVGKRRKKTVRTDER